MQVTSLQRICSTNDNHNGDPEASISSEFHRVQGKHHPALLSQSLHFANTATAIRFIETIGPTNAASVQSLSIYHEFNTAADFESDMDKILPQLSNIKSLRVDVRRFLLSLDGGLDGIGRAFWIVTTKQKRLIKVYYTSRSSEMGVLRRDSSLMVRRGNRMYVQAPKSL